MRIPPALTKKETGQLLDLVHRETSLLAEFFMLLESKRRALQKKSPRMMRCVLQRERAMVAQLLRNIQKRHEEEKMEQLKKELHAL